jgi:endo-1,4-beta-xylanase
MLGWDASMTVGNFLCTMTALTLHSGLTNAQSLREVAEHRGFLIGSEARAEGLRYNSAYVKLLAEQFNLVVPGHVFKFLVTHPAPNRFDFSEGDKLVEFAQCSNQLVHGHTLVWHEGLPDWITNGQHTPDQLSQILRTFIQTSIQHYKDKYPGRIPSWDVVNEAINLFGTGLRKSPWLKIGPDYIEKAFYWAHQADPNAKLYYNDLDGEGLGLKSRAIYQLVRRLKSRGVPIHGIGLQMHVRKGLKPKVADVVANMRRLAALGLEIRISEMDYALPVNMGVRSEDLREQAEFYWEILNACLNIKACKAFVVWGATDKYSWIPQNKPGWGAAVLFDEYLRPKPAFSAVLSRLKQ